MKLASAMLKADWMMINANIFSAVDGSTIIYCVSYTVCSINKSALRDFIENVVQLLPCCF